MRKLTVVLTALTLVFAAMPMAMADDTRVMKAEFEGGGMPVGDTSALASRCPAGSQWILQTFGAGKMSTSVYEGEFTLQGDHCSRYLGDGPDDPDRWYLGRVKAGAMTMSTPNGDLVVNYSGFFAFKGETKTPDFVAKVWLRYRIDGDSSTDVFEGASGRGLLVVDDNSGYETGQMLGTITLDD